MAVKKTNITEDMVRQVEIVARKWRKPNTDEHYHSVRVNIFLKHHSKPIELAHVPFEQGKDREYDRTAMIEWSKHFPQPGKARHFLSRHLEEKGISVTIHKSDVLYKKDL